MSPRTLEQRIRDAFHAASAPGPRGGFTEVRARLDRGERVPLDLPAPRGGVRHWQYLSVAAVLVGVLFWRPTDTAPTPGTATPPRTAARFRPDPLLALATASTAADAASLLRLDGTRLSSGLWVYRGGDGEAGVVDSVSFCRGTAGDEPAWLLSWTGGFARNAGALGSANETVALRQADLWPLARTVTLVSGYLLRELFTPDSSVSHLIAAGETTVTRAPGLSEEDGAGVMGMAGIRALLQAAPLDSTWQANVRVLGTDTTGKKVVNFRVVMKVTGEEKITVPAGTFDTWRVTLGNRLPQFTYWVSKRGRWVVKETTVDANGFPLRGGPIRELVRQDSLGC
jgi:hypothetical protein